MGSEYHRKAAEQIKPADSFTGKYEKIACKIGRLVDEKNRAYGDSFHKVPTVMKLLYPNGISVEQMDDALTIVRIMDKLVRIATDNDPFGENPFEDIAGYGILGTREKGKKSEMTL